MRHEQKEELEHIHRAHLWNRLRERVKHAQSDPSLLALLAREALELGFILPSLPEQSMVDPRAEPPSSGHYRTQ